MQEEQSVPFQPMYEGYQPWFAKLYVLYLLFVLVVMAVRFATFIWNLRKLRKLQKGIDPDFYSFNAIWTDCYAKAHTLKNLAILTFLLSLLTLTAWTADILFGVRTAKALNASYILPAIGDALTAFGLGIAFCIALYSGAMVTDYALKRRRSALSGQNSNVQIESATNDPPPGSTRPT